MAAALERESLEKLCSGETYQKARTILRLAKAKTGPGSGFLVTHHNALPGICAYIASAELNNNEVSQTSAVASACISRRDFTKALNTVRQALDFADRIKPQSNKINISSKPRPLTSARKTSKSAIKLKSLDTTPAKPLTLKRAVAFSRETMDDYNNTSPPETPTKRRRIESPSKLGGSVSSSKKRTTAVQGMSSSTTAFEQAMKGLCTPQRERKKLAAVSVCVSSGSHSPLVGPSARTWSCEPIAVATEVDEEQTECESAEPPLRKRFRPVFVDQQQWCSRDPKLSKIWDAAVEDRTEMMGLYDHPFEKYRPVQVACSGVESL